MFDFGIKIKSYFDLLSQIKVRFFILLPNNVGGSECAVLMGNMAATACYRAFHKNNSHLFCQENCTNDARLNFLLDKIVPFSDMIYRINRNFCKAKNPAAALSFL